MTRIKPPSSLHSSSVPSPSPASSPVRSKVSGKTRVARRVHKVLFQITEPVDIVGTYLLGEWWRPFIVSIQDAIAIGCLLWIPGLVFKFFSNGKDFSAFTDCSSISVFDPNFLACLGIVGSDYCFWILFLGRTLARFIDQVRSK